MIFFIGSFIYNVLDAQSRPGDQSTALSLAFQMACGGWSYRTLQLFPVPCWPATTLALPRFARHHRKRSERHNLGSQLEHTDTGLSVSGPPGPAATWARFVTRFFRPVIARWLSGMIENAYDSDFEAVTLWRRGPNKQRRINEAIKRFEEPDHPGQCPRK